jgi:hypothetical protein
MVKNWQTLLTRGLLFSTRFGPIKSEPKQKKEREKKKRTKFQETAEEVQVLTSQEEKMEETIGKVFQLYNVIKSKEKTQPDHMSFVDMTIDPNSFSKSIENIFHLGFLVKDGKIGLEHGMKVEIHEQATEEEQKTLHNKQTVLKFDLAKYNELKRKREE